MQYTEPLPSQSFNNVCVLHIAGKCCNFYQFAYNGSTITTTISEFLTLGACASSHDDRYAAIKSWVDMARKLGKTTVDLGDIESIKSESYRDTRGISVEQFKSMLEVIDPSTPIGVRDYAIILLFWGNALRRGEIASANIEDFLPQQQKLMILGKGKRAKVAIDLTDSVSYALEEWVNFHPCNALGQPLSCLDASTWRFPPGRCVAVANNLERRTVARFPRHTSSTRQETSRSMRR